MSDLIFGIAVPALVLFASFLVTWRLYRHFSSQGSRKTGDNSGASGVSRRS